MIMISELKYTVLMSNRLMEKDNKKAHDDSRREYNDTIRVRIHRKHAIVQK